MNMIEVTRLNGSQVVLNAELIEVVESTPDTVISLTTGRKLVVAETVAQIVERIMTYRHRLVGGVSPDLPAEEAV